MDEPSSGNLRLSMVKILTSLSLLIPAFSLLFRPHILSIMLHPMIESSPTTPYESIKNTILFVDIHNRFIPEGNLNEFYS